jgi:hypothetical protein
MGQEEVPGHVEAGGDGRAEQEGGGLEQGGAEAASINLRKNLDGTSQEDRNLPQYEQTKMCPSAAP